MGVFRSESPAGQDLGQKNIVELLEDIRLISLNLAVASSKFRAGNNRQDQVKKDLMELVSLALESVQFLTRFLEVVGLKKESDGNVLEVDHQKLEQNLKKISDYIENITDNLSRNNGP